MMATVEALNITTPDALDDVRISPIGDPHSKSYKRVKQQNTIEESACQRQQRQLEKEFRLTSYENDRKKEEARCQLEKLAAEKTKWSMDKGEASACGLMSAQFDHQMSLVDRGGGVEAGADCAWDADAVVNPYPIAFASTAGGRSRKQSTATDEQGGRSTRSCLESASLGSLSSPPPAAAHLPPLLTHRGSPASLSHSSLVSMEPPPLSPLSSSPDGGSWLGDPLAISSVRRPRKTVQQMKELHQWSRSTSLKEGCRGQQLKARGPGVSRSSSMRERGGSCSSSGWPPASSPRNLSRASSGLLARSDSVTLVKSEEAINDVVEAEVTSPRSITRLKSLPQSANCNKASLKSVKGDDVLLISINAPGQEPLPPISPRRSAPGKDEPAAAASGECAAEEGSGTSRAKRRLSLRKGSLKRRVRPVEEDLTETAE